ncbi:MAG: GNAT family N-acetyltransferase [Alphaproteobacteria bacterium]|nr:GNAT family N-acetyltransferase [Alphaproteobacteria bacterium]
MIRACEESDFEALVALINAAAQAYRGIIPPDRWKEPYMPAQELADEIAAGVQFQGFEEGGALKGVMGVQEVKDVTLIRHAYVDPSAQRQGIGAALLANCRELAERPLLIGTWAAADWAIRFYEKHGFERTSPAEKDRLLSTYWTIPERQIETSVVLADRRWVEANRA